MEKLKLVVLDTNAYSAIAKGNPDALAVAQQVDTLLIPPVVLGELLGGFLVGTRYAKNKAELDEFLAYSKVVVVEVNARTSEHYATIYKQLREAGTPIPTNDIWIAATALQFEAGIFTYDKHFEKIEGLRLVRVPEDIEDKN